MHWIRTAAVALALAALAMPSEALAKKGHEKHGRKKGARHAWVHPNQRRLERDIARLVAARPRLPDGSRIVFDAVRRPAPSAVVRRAAARAPLSRPNLGPTLVAQRRANAVGSYLRTHRPPMP